MADLSDVLETLYQQTITAVYPDGLSSPSVAGVDVTIVKGWPVRNRLDEQMKSGKALVSIFPTNKEKVVTKFERKFQTVSVSDPTLSAGVSGNTVTIGGTVTVPQSVMVIVDGIGYSYQVLITDTVDTIASALAGLIPNAIAVDNVITITDFHSLNARIATASLAAEELGRQEREFMITCWCPTPAIRSLLAPPIDKYLRINYLPVFSDGFVGMTFYSHTDETDHLELMSVFRRDLYFRVQYATTNTEEFMTIAQPVLDVSFVNNIE